MAVSRWLPLLLLLLLAFAPQDGQAAALATCDWMTADKVAAPDEGACGAYTGITNKAVKCIGVTLMKAAPPVMDGLRTIAWPIAQAVILFGFALVGYRLMLGGMGQNMRVELMMFVIKACLVVYFMFNMEEWFSRAVCVSGDFLNALTGVLKSQTGVRMMCIRGGDLDTFTIWNYMDCFIASILMMDPESASVLPGGPGASLLMVPLGVVIFGMVVAASFSGPIGTYLMLAGVAAIFTLLFSFFRAAYAFLVSIIAVMILLVISFFIIPLTLLTKFNDGNSIFSALFNGWLRALTTNLMMPLVVVSFVTFSVVALDYFFFSAPKSLMESVFLKQASAVSSADIERLRHGFLQSTSLNLGSMFVPNAMVPDPTARPDISTSNIGQTLNLNFNPSDITLPAMPSMNIRQHPVLQTAAAECLRNDACARELQNAYMEGMLSAFATMLVLAALIFAIMENLPNLGLRLIGDIGRSASIADMPFSSNTSSGMLPNIYGNMMSARDDALRGAGGQTIDSVRAATATEISQTLTDIPRNMTRGSIFEGMWGRR